MSFLSQYFQDRPWSENELRIAIDSNLQLPDHRRDLSFYTRKAHKIGCLLGFSPILALSISYIFWPHMHIYNIISFENKRYIVFGCPHWLPIARSLATHVVTSSGICNRISAGWRHNIIIIIMHGYNIHLLKYYCILSNILYFMCHKHY